MRVSFRDADPEALATLWNTVAPDVFRVVPSRVSTHLLGCPQLDWGASAVEMVDGKPVAFVAIKRSGSEAYGGADQDVAHIAAFACRECQFGVDLLAQAKRLLSNRGYYRLVFGADTLHFFPGMPDNWPMLHDFLMIEGFAPGKECVDLVQDLRDYQPPCDIIEAVVSVTTSAQTASLLEFLNREFPRRWAYDTQMKLEKESVSGFVYGLFIDGRCEGFAVTQDERHTLPIGGAVFPDSLGENWCAIGPIGVSNGLRGKGWGDALLASTIDHLKRGGKRNCRVDWTDLTDWYGRHGFTVERRYRSMSLDLEDRPI